MSKSCCGDDEPQTSKKLDHSDGDDHDHGSDEFNLKKEAIPVMVVVALFLIGSIYNEPLHNTPYAFAEYLILIPAY